MKISILVPVYGVEKYIEQCAESLFCQTYDDLEYVFVDDCSLDNSMEKLQSVLNRYAHRQAQVRIVRHEYNHGLGTARRTALAAATGDFVLHVDSDDYLLPNAVEMLVTEQTRTNADIVSGAYNTLSPDGTLQTRSIDVLDKSLMLKLLLVQHTIPYNIWARLIRRSLYTNNGIDAIEGVNMAEDYAVIPRLVCAAASLAYVTQPVYVYRLDSASGTFHDHMQSHHVVSILKANDAVCQYMIRHNGGGQYTFALETGMLNAYYLGLSAGFSREKIAELCTYKPQGLLFCMCHRMLSRQATKGQLRLVYLTIKWCYKRYLHFAG